MRFDSRLKALERIGKESAGKRIRLIMHGCSKSFQVNLATSTCKRTRRADGLIIENIELDGDLESMTEAEFEAWVESFPIKEYEA